MADARIQVWDAPVRLFHWALVALLAFSYVSVELEWMRLHMISGYCVLCLLLFRIVWGFVGSETARFRSFLRGPRAAIEHLAGLFERAAPHEIGHNAAGGWMVVALLGITLLQTLTGLCSNDDLLSEGPLAKYLGKHLSDRMSIIHSWNFDVLLAAIALHVAAIIYYAVFRRDNLLYPMITGWRRVNGAGAQPRIVSPVWALLTIMVAAFAVLGLALV